MEQFTIQSLGFLIGFQEDIKSPGPMEQFTIQSLGFLIGFQEDIKIVILIVVVVLVVVLVVIVIVIFIFILACPDARCESGQTSGSCRKISKPLTGFGCSHIPTPKRIH